MKMRKERQYFGRYNVSLIQRVIFNANIHVASQFQKRIIKTNMQIYMLDYVN